MGFPKVAHVFFLAEFLIGTILAHWSILAVSINGSLATPLRRVLYTVFCLTCDARNLCRYLHSLPNVDCCTSSLRISATVSLISVALDTRYLLRDCRDTIHVEVGSRILKLRQFFLAIFDWQSSTKLKVPFSPHCLTCRFNILIITRGGNGSLEMTHDPSHL